MEPLLTTTSDERPPCLWRTLTLVPTVSLFRIVLKKPLLCGHLSTPYYGHISAPNDAHHYKMTSCYGQLHPLFNDMIAKKESFLQKLSGLMYSADCGLAVEIFYSWNALFFAGTLHVHQLSNKMGMLLPSVRVV